MVKINVDQELIDELEALSNRNGPIIRLTKVKKDKKNDTRKKTKAS
jgi:ribosomal protein S6